VHLRASKGLKIGAAVKLAGGESAVMIGREGELFILRFSCDVIEFFQTHGRVPLPPYIDRGAEEADRERYQTVYARALGAVAAPTAGLHFDEAIFAALRARKIAHAFVTLHVGAGTFAPLRADDIERHEMHCEYLEVPEQTCRAIERARAAGGRVIAVGTTVVRSLETAAAAADAGTTADAQVIAPYRGNTRIFIKPGHVFRAIDAMITNFHLPESTLLMLCAAFAGRESLLAAYAHAVRARYRFFSYGDAMFLT
jgi:S-adenosylmethionine:tRNA ribosyltransferase-isomerase